MIESQGPRFQAASVAACAKKIRDCHVQAEAYLGMAVCALADAAASLEGQSATEDTMALARTGLRVGQGVEEARHKLVALSEKAGEEMLDILARESSS